MSLVRRLFGKRNSQPTITNVDDYIRTKNKAEKAGQVKGRHYTTYTGEVEAPKRNGENNKAAALLLQLVAAVEAQSSIDDMGIAPWYYEQLAILYR